MEVFAGPSFNLMVSDKVDENGDPIIKEKQIHVDPEAPIVQRLEQKVVTEATAIEELDQ